MTEEWFDVRFYVNDRNLIEVQLPEKEAGEFANDVLKLFRDRYGL